MSAVVVFLVVFLAIFIADHWDDGRGGDDGLMPLEDCFA